MYLSSRICLGVFAAAAIVVGGHAAPPTVEAPRVIDQPLWVFPHEVARESIYEGVARVLISVSEEGELLDFIILGYSHPAFAREVASALPKCRFAPGKIRGEPSTTRIPITINFAQTGTVVSMTSGEMLEKYIARIGAQYAYTATVCPGHKLDGPLVPAELISPGYPAELRHRAEPGAVTVDFYVDVGGRVRMPATSATSHPSFARAAIAAVEQWSFQPPTSGGEPVIVHVQQRFDFHAPPPEKKEAEVGARGATTAAAKDENSTRDF